MNRQEIFKELKEINFKIYCLYNKYTDICSIECTTELTPLVKRKKELNKLLKGLKK